MPAKQVPTRPITIRAIMSSPEFARGLDEVRRGLPLNPDIDRCDANSYWDYERGRAFGAIAPPAMPLRIGDEINPEALELAELAFRRGHLL